MHKATCKCYLTLSMLRETGRWPHTLSIACLYNTRIAFLFTLQNYNTQYHILIFTMHITLHQSSIKSLGASLFSIFVTNFNIQLLKVIEFFIVLNYYVFSVINNLKHERADVGHSIFAAYSCCCAETSYILFLQLFGKRKSNFQGNLSSIRV